MAAPLPPPTPPPTTYAPDARCYTAFPLTLSCYFKNTPLKYSLWAKTARLIVGLSIGIFRRMALHLAKYGMNGTVYYDIQLMCLRIFI